MRLFDWLFKEDPLLEFLGKGSSKMSKRSAGLERMRRTAKEVGPVTRKQQVAALRVMKSQEVAASVAAQVSSQMKKMVDEAVEIKIKAIKDTMLDLIDRVMTIEQTMNHGAVRPHPKESPLDNIRYHCSQCGFIGADLADHRECGYVAVEVRGVNFRSEVDKLRAEPKGSPYLPGPCKQP